MEHNLKLVMEYIAIMRKSHQETIEKKVSDGIDSKFDAYTYGYAKGGLSELDFIEGLLNI